jgi:small conductance mechanosensitive channel
MFWLRATAVEEIESNVDELNDKVGKLTEITDGMLSKIIDFGFDLLIAIVIFIAGRIVLRLLRKLIHNVLNKSNVDVGVVKFVDSIIKVIGYLVIIIIICGEIGIQTTSLITLLGTASLSIGLALEGCLSNFAGGVLILVTKPFVVGDYIVVNDVEGNVEKIDIIYTTLLTVDNKSIKIPNGTVSNSVLTNVTHQTKRRVDVSIGIHYEDDIKKAKEILAGLIKRCEYALSDDENVVIVKELAESSITLEIRMWSLTENYWAAKFYLNEAIKEAFDENGIRIPYNQLDVNIHQEMK